MKPTTILLSLCLPLTTVSCAAERKQVSGPEAIANLTSDPLDCMIYRGGDATFYFFDRDQFKTTTRLKVKREELELPSNTQVGDIPLGMKVRTRPATLPAR